MVRLTRLLVVMAALFSTPVSADFYSHRYVGIGFLDSETAGYCTEASAFINSFQSDTQSATATGCSEAGNGLKLYGGWRWTPHLAIELDLRQNHQQRFGFNISNPDVPYLNRKDEVTTRQGNMFFVGHLPVGSSGLSAFAKLGGGFWLSQLKISQRGEALFSVTGQDGNTSEVVIPVSGGFRDNASGLHWGYGAGLSYRYNNSWSIRAEWELFPDIGSEELRGLRDVETASVSWAMHF